MMGETPALAAGEAGAIPASSALIEVHVAELRQLFNLIDPSPFRDRDLAPAAEAFMLEVASAGVAGTVVAVCWSSGGYSGLSGAGESWLTFGRLRLEPRRGNEARQGLRSCRALLINGLCELV
jgi:hypothetical protein